MKYRPMEEVAGSLEQKKISFASLMPWRVRNILLVSSIYDSFTFEEDGNLSELLVSEYLELNLSFTPVINRASTAREAIARLKIDPPDLVISMPRVGDMDVFEFGRTAKELCPELPVILLAYNTRELSALKSREEDDSIDRIFVWQGDARLFLAIIKMVEDLRNAQSDASAAGVKSILLIEDSVRFYSAYLPMLYTEIMEQTQGLMADGVNRMQRLLRMRARPKILFATGFEEGAALLDTYRDNILGVITDARFPRGGSVDPNAGHAFIRLVKQQDVFLPVLMQSTDEKNKELAEKAGAQFIQKTSKTLLRQLRGFLRERLGFGDFFFQHPNGSRISSASTLRELEKQIKTLPDASLQLHATRNDFSTWFMARTEFDLAKALRPVTPGEFSSAAEMREFLLGQISQYRRESRAGIVEDFSRETFEASSGVTRIGKGSLGGKGRGLAFINSLLNSYHIANHVDGIKIFVPPSAVVATGVFEKFMEESGLAPLALDDTPDAAIQSAFLAAHLPEKVVDELRVFLTDACYPLAVRSSSLLEDSSHQPFAGIYDTFMLPNNHPDLTIRLHQLCSAIRLVYASTFYMDSKSYIESTPNRLEEERMAVIIQQVIGDEHEGFIYPHLAGVARSHDYYPMKDIKPEDGVVSAALGLGRTVVDGGRCVRFSPAHPGRLYQFSSPEEYLKNSQREFFALDLSTQGPSRDRASCSEAFTLDQNLKQLDLEAAFRHETLTYLGSVYSDENHVIREGVYRPGVKLVSLAGVLSGDYCRFPETIQFLLEVGKAGFSCDVEIEFAVKLRPPGQGPHEFAFLQIRPLVLGSIAEELDLTTVCPDNIICSCDRALGHGRIGDIHDLVYVRPENFNRSETVNIAGEVGSFNARLKQDGRPFILIGPGRWGSADPWLGIPVRWSQISGVGCIVETELPDMHVEPSQGTHFFQNITSFGIGYFTVNNLRLPASLDQAWLDSLSAESESRFVRHLRFEEPLEVVVDGRTGKGIILRPGCTTR
jgi:CheY-like chemotaxis protein